MRVKWSGEWGIGNLVPLAYKHIKDTDKMEPAGLQV